MNYPHYGCNGGTCPVCSPKTKEEQYKTALKYVQSILEDKNLYKDDFALAGKLLRMHILVDAVLMEEEES